MSIDCITLPIFQKVDYIIQYPSNTIKNDVTIKIIDKIVPYGATAEEDVIDSSDEDSESEEVSGSGSPSENGRKVFNQIDKLLQELSNADNLPITHLEHLVLKICSMIHQSQKKFTKELAISYEKARDARMQEAIGHMRGRTTVIISTISSALHVGSGLGGLAPQSMFWGAQKLNDASHYATSGKFTPFAEFINRFDVSNADHLHHISKISSEALSGFGRASDGLHGILSERKNSHQTEHQSKSEDYKLKKEEIHQESSQEGARADDNKRQAAEMENKRHEAALSVMRA